MSRMLINLWFLHAFCASAVGGDVLSERWANARRTFPQLRRNELGERVCRMWEQCREFLEQFSMILEPLGPIWEPFWAHFLAVWG